MTPSSGGGVFSRCAMGSGAAGAAGLYATGTGSDALATDSPDESFVEGAAPD